MLENKSFVAFDNNKIGMLFDDSLNHIYPVIYYNHVDGEGVISNKDSSYFGFVYSGEVQLRQENECPALLCDGMYFSINGSFCIDGIGKTIIIEAVNGGYYKETGYKSMRAFGGKIEDAGRLKYIDGCTDSLLIPPVKYGDPCLNHLHFPPNIDQTQHTHPSHRIGIVSSGHGLCKTPFGNMELTEGMIFVIKEWDNLSNSTGLDGEIYPDGTHSFQTFNVPMNVIAFHPDSDFGATDIEHPMINRTIVGGVSAKNIESIQTK